MALLTLSELKEHVETDLSDPALQRVLDAAEQRITEAAGANPDAKLTERFETRGFRTGNTRHIWLSRALGTVSAITEREHHDNTATTLTDDDWQQFGSRELVRLREGTNPRLFWAPLVEVTYTPFDDSDQRKIVQVDLAKAMLNFQGFASERFGDFQASHLPPETVAEILRPLTGAAKRMPVR